MSPLVSSLCKAFAVGFVGALVPAISGWGASPNFHFQRAAAIALLSGAVAAGARAAIAVALKGDVIAPDKGV